MDSKQTSFAETLATPPLPRWRQWARAALVPSWVSGPDRKGWTVRRKLTVAFATVVLLMVWGSVFSILQINRLERGTVMLRQDGARKSSLAQDAQRQARAQEAGLYGLFLAGDRDTRVSQYKAIDKAKLELSLALERLRGDARDPGEIIMLQSIMQARKRFQAEYDETVDLVELNNLMQARERMSERTVPELDMLTAWLEELVKLEGRRVEQQIADSEQAAHEAKRLITTLAVLGVLLSLASVVAITRSVSRRLVQAVGFADQIAQGELNAQVPTPGGGELRTLVQALERMRNGIASRERRITDLAFYDPLTRLPNRTLLQQRLDEALLAAEGPGPHFSLLALNLNRFRNVNDALGYAAGDTVLVEVARRIEATLAGRGLVARQQADDFSVLLPGADAARAHALALEITQAVARPVAVAGQPVDVLVSVGYAVAPAHGMSSGQLIASADHALHAAKRAHNGPTMYDISHALGVANKLSLLGELQHAIEHDELQLHYQPQLALRTGAVTRAEVLVRWLHPGRGMVPPDAFIPYAEQTGAIRAVTRWVLEQACRQLAAWQDSGLDIAICVNLSARDLSDEALPELLGRLLREYDLDHRLLILEVTESAAMEDPQQGLRALERLRRLGLRLAIDDFGTGYSSLSYLKQLPAEELKIDKSFVLNMDHDTDDRKIVRATVDLGHVKGLEVVAEGVESEQTMMRLREYGCDYAQGYHIARPMTADKFEAWLRQRTPGWTTPVLVLPERRSAAAAGG